MARKKIVFVIVEGPSDDEALSVLLENIYDQSRVFVHITYGDITTTDGVKASNILAKIGGVIAGYAKANHFQKSHFQEIVHILDMDGAYISNDAITEDQTRKEPFYSLTEIRTRNVAGIRSRNEIKRGCLDRISRERTVWGIPYQAYYMSCNLDHVLYGMQNLTDEEKEKNALVFAKRYRSDIEGFIRFISKSSFAVMDEYTKSWAFIKQGLRSLERHTNLGICLEKATAGSNRPIRKH